MKHVLSCVLCGVLLVALTATGALAQATAQITGTVKDSSGGVLPGASVSATQTETGFKREVVTDAAGLFSFPGIPVGPYKLDVTLQGFQSTVQTGIVLQVNSNQAVLWAALRRLEITEPIAGLGRLFSPSSSAA